MASGISASPQALSIGGLALSATTTRRPCWRAAIAAASPAGPPPITKTSVEFSNDATSPLQKQKLGTKPGSHGGKQTQRARLRAPVFHHVFEHTQHRSRREIPHLAQAIPGGIQLSIVQSQCVCRSIQHFRSSGVENETLKIASLVSVVRQKCVHVTAKVLPDQGRDLC